tara:strand:- start:1 stop:840 length:840 start_codon:yes stop_codon:yes gene_type:complete
MEFFPILLNLDNSPNPWWAYLCAGMVSLGIALGFYLSIRQLRLERESYLFEINQIDALKEGPCRIEGEIVSLNPPFTSPWSKKECVYYNFTVQGPGGVYYEGEEKWVDLISDEQWQTFKVTDSAGSVYIEPIKKVDLRIKADARKYIGLISNAPQELQPLLRGPDNNEKPDGEHMQNHPLVEFVFSVRKKLLMQSSQERRVFENVLTVGTTVCVLGEASLIKGKWVIGDGKTPFIVSENIERAIEERIPIKGLVLVMSIFSVIAIGTFVAACISFFRAS